jgi:hypothetical protein
MPIMLDAALLAPGSHDQAHTTARAYAFARNSHRSASSMNLARRAVAGRQMTGDQSRTLRVGDRVCWGDTTTDLGTVIGTSWSEVTISWDDGEANSVSHNDMAQVERVPVKLM